MGIEGIHRQRSQCLCKKFFRSKGDYIKPCICEKNAGLRYSPRNSSKSIIEFSKNTQSDNRIDVHLDEVFNRSL